MTSEVFCAGISGVGEEYRACGSHLRPRSTIRKCSVTKGDIMESEHNQICECPLLDELEMPNASLPDGHTAGIVGT